MKDEIKEQLDMVCDILDNAIQAIEDIDYDDKKEILNDLTNIQMDISRVQAEIKNLMRGNRNEKSN